MKKTLWIFSLISGILCLVSAVVLGCIYLENIAESVIAFKNKVLDKFCNMSPVIDDNCDID